MVNVFSARKIYCATSKYTKVRCEKIHKNTEKEREKENAREKLGVSVYSPLHSVFRCVDTLKHSPE